MPVSCVTRGTCRAENQCGTSRSTEMNVTASPRPTTARAANAVGSDSVNASAARRHHRGPGEDQRLGAESVEQQAGRHLRAGIDDDLKDHECGQRARAGAEAVRGIQTGHAEGGAVEDRDDVCEQSGGPDNPGTRTEPFAAEMGLRYRKRVATP